jgi:methionyl aminopeptidase
VSIESEKDLAGLRAAGNVVAEALEAMRAAVRPGVTTRDLDEVGATVFARYGAQSAPQLAYDFPGVNCISVNDQAVHGVPSERTLAEGDLVKLDVTAELDGYMADAAITVGVGAVTDDAVRLVAAAERALTRALGVARAGVRLNEIGRAVQSEVEEAGFFVLPQLGGHGIGRTIHEPPSVPNHYVASDETVLTEGLVDHNRADHLGDYGKVGRPGGRRVDDLHRRSRPFGARRAYDRHHARCTSCPDGRLKPGDVAGSGERALAQARAFGVAR